MDKILKGIGNVSCYIDDIIIADIDFKDLEQESKVFARLQEFGVGKNKSKCKFFETQVEYLRVFS